MYEKEYGYILESYDGGDVLETANIVIKKIAEDGFIHNWDFEAPNLGPSYLLRNKIGSCTEGTDFMTYVFRALGIPITKDFFIYSPETRCGHQWNVIRMNNGNYASFYFPDFPIVDKENIDLRKVGKIYRMYWGVNADDMSLSFLKDNNVPAFFRGLHHKDVTDTYWKTKMVLDIPPIKDQYVYLGLFGLYGWVGVGYAKIEKNKVEFVGVQPDCIYSILLYRNNKYQRIGYPFYFDGKDISYFIPDKTETNTVTLYRKYPFYRWMEPHMGNVINSRFECSDSENFISSELLYEVKDSLKNTDNSVIFSPSVKCRYFRYRSPEGKTYAEMAEIHVFYEGKERIPVKVWGGKPAFLGTSPMLLCDNDPLTYFSSDEQGSSVYFDLGRMVDVDSLTFMPRNDDDYVRIGDTYELFYHDKDTLVSLGKTMATEPKLVYKNIPRGALFHLHDLTRGEEEAAFYIKDGKQMFVAGLDKK